MPKYIYVSEYFLLKYLLICILYSTETNSNTVNIKYYNTCKIHTHKYSSIEILSLSLWRLSGVYSLWLPE